MQSPMSLANLRHSLYYSLCYLLEVEMVFHRVALDPTISFQLLS